MLFEPLIKKLAWHLNGENVVFQLNRLDWNKPGFITLVMDIILNYFKTAFPYINGLLFHPYSKSINKFKLFDLFASATMSAVSRGLPVLRRDANIS